jgi:hypothetical protein
VTVKILYTKIRNKRYLNANKIIEIQKTTIVQTHAPLMLYVC